MKAPVIVLLAVSLIYLPAISAQRGELPRFEVASVKVSTKPYLSIAPTRSGGRIQWTTDLQYVLGYAFHMQLWQISGSIPGSTSIFEFDVVTDAAATDEQVRLMFQSLLIDRFHMAFHRATKQADGYALTVAKGGPRMEEAKDEKIPPLPDWFRARSGDSAQMEGSVAGTSRGGYAVDLVGRRVTMAQLSEALQWLVRTAVFDRTGLTGRYYFAIEYADDDAPPEVTLPNLFAALKELGLQVVKQTGEVEALVVDRIEKTPTEN